MKKILITLLLALITINVNCGSGGGTSTKGVSSKTTVTINLGEVRDASVSWKGIVCTLSIPPHVVEIRILITAPELEPKPLIEDIIPTAGITEISRTYEVPIGPNRHFVVEALNAASATGGVSYRSETYVNLNATGGVLYRGETYADTYEPVSLTIIMVSADPIPPTFAGLSSIDSITQTSMALSWLPATDNVTPQDKIQYLIYMATTSGGQNFSTPTFTTSLGATTYTVTGLSPETMSCYVVRAMDEVGNQETNTKELCVATTPSLSISPSTVTITALPNPDSLDSDNVTFTIQGGVPPYNVTSSNTAVIPDPGAIPASGGTFTIDPDQDCSITLVTLTVNDSVLESVDATVNLTIPVATAAITPSTICENDSTCTAGTETSTLTLTGVPPFDVTSSDTTVIPDPGSIWTDTYVIDAIDNSITADASIDLFSSSYCDSGPNTASLTVINQTDIDLLPINDGSDTSTIYCDVANTGADNAVNVEVWFWYDDCYAIYCDTDTVSVPGGGTQPALIGYFSGTLCDYMIIVDPNNTIQESNENNNCVDTDGLWCSLSLPGSCPFGFY